MASQLRLSATAAVTPATGAADPCSSSTASWSPDTATAKSSCFGSSSDYSNLLLTNILPCLHTASATAGTAAAIVSIGPSFAAALLPTAPQCNRLAPEQIFNFIFVC